MVELYEARYNGKIIDLLEINERELREASKDGKLACIFGDCRHARIIYKHGPIREAHFAHERGTFCEHKSFSNQSFEHRVMKVYLEHVIPKFNNILEIKKEKEQESTIPDVYVKFSSSELGIEVQCSPLNEHAMQAKFDANMEQGIYTLYIFHKKLLRQDNYYSSNEDLYRISEAEKFLHYLNGARLYYFSVNEEAESLENMIEISSIHLESVDDGRGKNLHNVRKIGDVFNVDDLGIEIENRRNKYYSESPNYSKWPKWRYNKEYWIGKFSYDRPKEDL